MTKHKVFDVDVSENLYEWEKMTIADALEAITFDDGDIIVKEGDDGEDFFIIVDGSEKKYNILFRKTGMKYNFFRTAIVTQIDPESGESRELSRLTSPDYFGEISLLLNQPRVATVGACGQLKCVKLDRAR